MSFSKLRTYLDFDVENCNVAHVRRGSVQPGRAGVDAITVCGVGPCGIRGEPLHSKGRRGGIGMLQYVLVGLALGSIYAIAASGLVVTFVSAGVLNFAFGSMAYVVARFYYWLNSQHHMSTMDRGVAVDRASSRRCWACCSTSLLFRFIRGKSTADQDGDDDRSLGGVAADRGLDLRHPDDHLGARPGVAERQAVPLLRHRRSPPTR